MKNFDFIKEREIKEIIGSRNGVLDVIKNIGIRLNLISKLISIYHIYEAITLCKLQKI